MSGVRTQHFFVKILSLRFAVFLSRSTNIHVLKCFVYDKPGMMLSTEKLYALDVQITQLDPAWPVTAPPPSSIHFNPKFLKTTSTTVSDTSTAPIISKSSNALMTNKNTSSLDPKTLSMQQKLLTNRRNCSSCNKENYSWSCSKLNLNCKSNRFYNTLLHCPPTRPSHTP
ncbi:hypothetical protein FQR65_LT16546 [Abscondita terminalis]|nr:hypothetical protein FQR65_LT16546 [Abscondita terminalis]